MARKQEKTPDVEGELIEQLIRENGDVTVPFFAPT